MNNILHYEWFHSTTINDTIGLAIADAGLIGLLYLQIRQYQYLGYIYLFALIIIALILFSCAVIFYRYIIIGVGQDELVVFSVPHFEVEIIKNNDIVSIRYGWMPFLFGKSKISLQKVNGRKYRHFIGAIAVHFCIIIETYDFEYFITWNWWERGTIRRISEKFINAENSKKR
jgi:hypothetical protein